MKLSSKIWKSVAGMMMVLMVAGFSGCASTYNVTTDYDQSTNFQQYRTWNWYQEKPVAKSDSTRRYSTFLDKRIKTAVEAEMARRGFEKADASQADMLLAYDVTFENYQDVNPSFTSIPSIGFGYWYGYRYAYTYNRMINTTSAYNYREGTILLDIVDRKSNELIWRGTGETTGGEKAMTQEKVQEIVTKILAKYPPQAGTSATASR